MGAIGGLLGLGGSAGGGPTAEEYGRLHGAQADTQQALNQQKSLLQALQGQGGLQKQTDVYGQLQNIAAGQGPNPALAQLAQATGANVANQAALAAGQRGAAANPALIARQAAQTGANLQQQAAGQGATMQAQQALNALGMAQNQANTLAGQQLGQTNQNVASQQALQDLTQQAMTARQGQQAQMAQSQMGAAGKLLGGVAQGIGGGIASLFGAEGGQVPQIPGGPQSAFAKALISPMATGGNVGDALKAGGHVPGQAKVAGDSYKNDTVNAKLSPGEIVIPRSVINSKDPIKGSAEFVRAVLAKKGKRA